MTLSFFTSLFISTAFAMAPQTEGVSLPNAPAIMIQIASCESRLRQYDGQGNVLRGPTKDIGLFQIAPLWIPTAKRLGYDIFTEKGNIAMALYIYDKYGTSPWTSSEYCWKSG